MARMLSRGAARAFYDRLGARQDLQRFYEDPATGALLAHAGFGTAQAVVELGCGTGLLASRLLAGVLPGTATYVGTDLSPVMVRLATERLRPWAPRARVELTDGSPRLPLPAASCDRFLSTYVLDLLPEEEIRAVLAEAARVLRPGGRLCLVCLTFGETPVSRAVCRAWGRVHAWRPGLVGGCRPLRLLPFLDGAWEVLHRQVVCRLGICSEVVVAGRRGP
jgi:ubiquinone/menaquinone biosynthesis C-methylase UbiE